MTQVRSNGVEFEIPGSWSYLKLPPRRWDDGGAAGVNFHVASMAVPLDDDSGFASGTMGELGPMDVGMVLQEVLPDRVIRPGEGYYSPSQPQRVSRDEFSEFRLQVTRPGQFGYLAPFTASHRAFSFYAVLGGEAAARDGIPALNAILDSIRIGAERD